MRWFHRQGSQPEMMGLAKTQTEDQRHEDQVESATAEHADWQWPI
jgi:hypothetical protein